MKFRQQWCQWDSLDLHFSYLQFYELVADVFFNMSFFYMLFLCDIFNFWASFCLEFWWIWKSRNLCLYCLNVVLFKKTIW